MINGFAQWFWILITLACLVWYSTMTLLVAVRGLIDIRGMLKRLREDYPGIEKENGNPS